MPLIPVTIVQGAGAAPLDDAEYQTFNIAAGNSFFETMTAGGANTKGTYDEWCSSCPFDADGFFVSHSNHAHVANYLLDVGVGAASSEVVIVSNILLTGVSSASGNNSIPRVAYFPVPIASGARVAGRIQCTTAASSFRSMFMPVRGGLYSTLRSYMSGVATTYGANTADSGGTEVDPGLAANTKGSWVTIGTLTEDIHALMVATGSGAVAVAQNAMMDIGIGAGTPTVLIPDFPDSTSGIGSTWPGWNPLWFVELPAGTVISARAQSSITTANRLRDATVIGFS